MRLILTAFLLFSFIVSCQQSEQSAGQFESPEALVESLPKVQPKQRTEFSEVDTLFFQHLAYNTIPNDDGSFVLGDRQGAMILHIDSTGRLINRMARRGRGPGEVLDMRLTRRPNGGIIAHDYDNKKAVLFSPEMEFKREFGVKNPEGKGVSDIYGLNEKDEFICRLSSTNWLFEEDEKRVKYLARYNSDSQTYGKSERFSARQRAIYEIAGGAAMSASDIPYTSRRVIRYNPEDQTFWTMWTGTGEIAELDTEFDTLRTVRIELPRQGLSGAEIDTLETRYQKGMWEVMQNKLPDQKVAIEDMRLDEQGRFWLKLNYRSDYEQWLIADSTGALQKIVQLPKDVMLTHVSQQHLGVRLDANTFALYQAVE